MQLSAFAAGSVTLAWNPSTDPIVVGFNIYYGGASVTYTNEFSVGMRNEYDHFRPGPGSHLLFCSDHV